MKCSITLQIDTMYVLDLMFSIIIIYHLRMCMLKFSPKNCTYDIPHTDDMKSFPMSDCFI